MVESMQSRIQAVAEARGRVQQMVDALRGRLAPFAEVPLEAIRLHDSSPSEQGAWSNKPCELVACDVDLGEVRQLLAMLEIEWRTWVGTLEDLRRAFETIPPEDVDDLLLQFPILREDPTLLDLSHGEL